jgi:hypothetical protein
MSEMDTNESLQRGISAPADGWHSSSEERWNITVSRGVKSSQKSSTPEINLLRILGHT